MTQIEIETKVTELKNIYSDRRRDLIAHFTPKIEECQKAIKELKIKYDEIHIELHRQYSDLVLQDSELNRKGLAYYSQEREAVQTKMREIKIQLKEERTKYETADLELATTLKKVKQELQNNLFNNARMRNKAKEELWSHYDKKQN